jgi:uncharacterized protein YbjT (DUF2867 family)
MMDKRIETPCSKSTIIEGTILVTGATGFVGGNLVPRLLERGYRVRCLVRDAEKLKIKSWYSLVEVVTGDISTCETLVQSLEGISAAYYLVHNMSYGKHYIEEEAAAAQNFADAADQAGVQHIIYLGGLADPNGHIGRHMRSRLQTGEILRKGNVPVTELRASLIIGAGSISFEMIRYMTEQLPILIGPRWVNYLCQPVSIRNVLDYLLCSLENPACEGRIYEIGGTEVLKYSEVMKIYAEMRMLKRPFIIFPFITVSLMAFVIDKMTPVKYAIANPLLDGMQSDSIILNYSASTDFPDIKRDGYREAVRDILENLTPERVERMPVPIGSRVNFNREGFFVDTRSLHIHAPAEAVFAILSEMGGQKGWLYLDWLWRLRGWIDRMLGGPGMRGRSSNSELQIGDIIDFYRIDALTPGQMVRMKAELNTPGVGWMEWQVKPTKDGGTVLTQYAFFAPKGFWGFFYWTVFSPFHRIIFIGMPQAIKKKAEQIRR